jgi:urocanate hydratase
VREIQSLSNDETLLVQSGRPVGVFRSHEEVPRALIASARPISIIKM